MRRDTARGVTRRRFLLASGATGALATAGCIETRATYEEETDDGGDEISGNIGVAGSSTVYPLTRAMRVEFLDEYPEVSISVQSTGTGGGFGSYFCEGDRAINNASRRITDGERESCASNGVEPVELRVATDALTVVVNNDADWVDCLTVEELRQIWSENGVQRWGDLREGWPNEPFDLYGPASTSGTFDYFNEQIIGEDSSHRGDYQATEDDNTIVTGVQGSDYGIGYMGFAYYQGNSDAVKAVSIEDPETDAGCVEPSLETAAEGEYTPLARPLFIYVAKDALAETHIAEFCRYYIHQTTNEEIVSESVGYVPLTEAQQIQQLGRLELAIREANDATER
jgi:phosphate transport system substrate-binding protein